MYYYFPDYMEAIMEIERKYLIDEIPFDLKDYSCKVIEQGYLNTDPVVRVRRSNDKYILTYKGSGLMVREEYNLPLINDFSVVLDVVIPEGDLTGRYIQLKQCVATMCRYETTRLR